MALMCGKNPMHISEMKGSFELSNGMHCVYGRTTEGICVDVYEDATRKNLVAMQHDIQTNVGLDEEILKHFMESLIDKM